MFMTSIIQEEKAMPNHYTTRVTIRGNAADLNAFDAKHIIVPGFEDEPQAHQFDFNTVIAMPKELEGTISGSKVDEGLIVLGLNEKEALRYLTYPWVQERGITTLDGVKALLKERYPDCVVEAERHLKIKEITGYLNWHDWSVDNWGTKWNSYGYRGIINAPKWYVFQFYTAWEPPIPVLRKLTEMWPTLKFTFQGHDECEDYWSSLDQEVAGLGTLVTP
jgi:Ferredoxin-like domain in Api92-like protein